MQTEYWTLFKENNWNRYHIVSTTKGVDLIIEYTLVDNPNFSDLNILTTQIEKKPGNLLTLLSKLIDDGKIKSVIDKRCSLDETAEAHRYYEKSLTIGKVGIEVFHK